MAYALALGAFGSAIQTCSWASESRDSHQDRIAYTNQDLSKRGKKIHLEFIPQYATDTRNRESACKEKSPESAQSTNHENSTVCGKSSIFTGSRSGRDKSGRDNWRKKQPELLNKLSRQQIKNLLNSKLPAPSQVQLDRLVEQCDRVRVYAGGEFDGKPLSKTILSETSNPMLIHALKSALQIDTSPKCYEHDTCLGDPTIELLNGKKRLAVLAYHHGKSLRWTKAWRFDAKLEDGYELAQWLEMLNVPEPKIALEAARKEERQSSSQLQAWILSTPVCLREHLIDSLGLASNLVALSPDPKSLQGLAPRKLQTNAQEAKLVAVLNENYQSEKDAILALMQWYGTGTGSWSAYPAYEDIPARLLLLFPTKKILQALTASDVSPPEFEGAARFFSSYCFLSSKPNDLRLLDKGLKEHFLSICAQSQEPSRQERGRQAFASAIETCKEDSPLN